MRYDYYRHKSGGKLWDYFGGVGDPVKIGFFEYYFLKLLGYRVTKVCEGTKVVHVIVQAAIKAGAGPNSYKVQEILKNGKDI